MSSYLFYFTFLPYVQEVIYIWKLTHEGFKIFYFLVIYYFEYDINMNTDILVRNKYISVKKST